MSGKKVSTQVFEDSAQNYSNVQYAPATGSTCYSSTQPLDWNAIPSGGVTSSVGSYLCFRAQGSGVWGYLSYALQTPVVATFAGSRGTITITWPATNVSQKYFSSSSAPTCSHLSTGTWNTVTGTTTSLTNQNNGVYLCTETTIASGSNKVSGYATIPAAHPRQLSPLPSMVQQLLKSILPPPTLLINNTGIAIYPPINPTCTAASVLWADLDISTPITGLGSNAYVCVQATDDPVTGYTGYTIQSVSAATLDTDTAGQITITWPTATGISAKRYFTSTTDPTCDQTKTSGWTTATGATTALNWFD